MSKTSKRVFEFASFRVDVAERQVTRDGEIVMLTPKVFDILLVLLENRGKTVEKVDLIRQIWDDTFVEEGSLNRNISTLRKALGDDSSQQKFIKTLPKRGYRFTAQVREFTHETDAVFEETRDSNRLFVRVTRTFSQQRGVMLTTLAGVAILVAGLIWFLIDSPHKAIDLTGLPQNERRQLEKYGSRNRGARQAYVTGRSLWHRRSAEDLHNSIYYLERAIRIDPDFALAHAALADSYAFDVTKWKEAEQRANEAIRLNSDLGQPYATIGFVRMFWQWKLAAAGESYRKAIELTPDYATAHQWYAINLVAARAGGAALAEMKRAVELEPESLAISADLCQLYYFVEKYDDAIAQCQKTLAVDPNFLNAHMYLYEIYTAREMNIEATDEFFRIEQLKSDFGVPFSHQEKLRRAFAQGGIRSFWQTHLEVLEKNSHTYDAAKYYARLGENERALAALKASAEKRDFDFVFIQVEPVFRELNEEPAFHELKGLIRTDLKP